MNRGSTYSSKSDRHRRRSRRQSLGQHYLNDLSVVRSMIALAAIKPGERVLEIGTGRGALTRELLRLTPNFEGYEVDVESYEKLRKELPEAKILNEDAFESATDFDVLLSSLPYSESSNFVEWLSLNKYDRAVLLLQRDFAEKLVAAPGSRSYRAVSVISQASSKVEIITGVPREAFDPPPRVNSCIVSMRWRRTLNESQISMIKRIFSQKRRTVKAALKSLGLQAPSSAPEDRNEFLQCRVGSLRPESVLAMTSVISRRAK